MWIEIYYRRRRRCIERSRLARALWIEIYPFSERRSLILSRLARALWIEIFYNVLTGVAAPVEARESLVD